ncbi:DUF4333 domain-containing protein [Nannocystaceae bacterium ST9]
MRLALALVVVAALPTLAACELLENKVAKDKLEAELEAWLEKNDLKASEIVCPDNQKMEKGNVFECNCKIGGIDVPVRVEVTDAAEGTVEWQTKYTTVKHTQIESGVPALPELAGRSITVDCPDEVLVSVPGSEWKCDAVDAGIPMLLTLKFTDGEGTYEWALAPK